MQVHYFMTEWHFTPDVTKVIFISWIVWNIQHETLLKNCKSALPEFGKKKKKRFVGESFFKFHKEEKCSFKCYQRELMVHSTSSKQSWNTHGWIHNGGSLTKRGEVKLFLETEIITCSVSNIPLSSSGCACIRVTDWASRRERDRERERERETRVEKKRDESYDCRQEQCVISMNLYVICEASDPERLLLTSTELILPAL